MELPRVLHIFRPAALWNFQNPHTRPEQYTAPHRHHLLKQLVRNPSLLRCKFYLISSHDIFALTNLQCVRLFDQLALTTFASDFFEGHLASIILNRNLEGLKEALGSYHLNLRQEGYGYLSITLVELTIVAKWHDGLRVLSTQWSDEVSSAFVLAGMENDTVSLELLLTEFNGGVHRPLVCRFLLRWDRIGDFLRNWLWRQRRQVIYRCRPGYHSTGVQQVFCPTGINSENDDCTGVRMVEAEALSVIYFHIAESIQTFPMNQIPIHELVQGLDELFQKDFAEINNLKAMGKTPWPRIAKYERIGIHDDDGYIRNPLHCVLENISRVGYNLDTWTTLCVWLLQKGSNPDFRHSLPGSNLLLELARGLRHFVLNGGDRTLRYWEELVRYAAGLFDAMARDYTICFCSPNGRLLLIQSMIRDQTCLCMRHAEYHTFRWIQLCELDSEDGECCVEESVRLELFRRLGMKHTCCCEVEYSRRQAQKAHDSRRKGGNPPRGRRSSNAARIANGSLPWLPSTMATG